MQQGDVLIYNTTDGGEITVADGFVEMSGGLESAVYLSMFGADDREWWGNIGENNSARRYSAKTQQIIDGLPAVPSNLRRLEDAINSDLKWLKDESIASSVEVATAIVAPKRVQIDITVKAEGKESRFRFVENWSASA